MKEYPIIFSPPMIRALLADRKFVTRRLDLRWKKVKAGDRLWVKEGWRPTIAPCGMGECDCCSDVDIHYYANGEKRFFPNLSIPRGWTMPKAAAKGQVTCLYMPRWASRILLECEENARLERLQDITQNEAQFEGMHGPIDAESMWQIGMTPRDAFAQVWAALHTKPGERWRDNPEVVRVGKFRRIK